MVEEGIDLSIRVGELPDSSLIARRYTNMKVHFVASPEYLSEHGIPKHPKQLAQHQCIIDTSNRLPGRFRYWHKNEEEQVPLSKPMMVTWSPSSRPMAMALHNFLPFLCNRI
jgi:DNA-binding transcriptional LysR family regulator